MDAGAVGIILLAPALFLAEPPDVVSEPLANIHAGKPAALSPINLQTISDICLDFSAAFERMCMSLIVCRRGVVRLQGGAYCRFGMQQVTQDARFDLTGFNEIATQVAGTCGTTFQPAK